MSIDAPKMSTIDPLVQGMMIGLVFGFNVALLLSSFLAMMDWCSDPLAVKLQNDVNRLQELNSENDDKINELMDTIHDLEEKIKEMEERSDDCEEENETLYDEIYELKDKNKALRERVNDLRAVIRLTRDVDGDEVTHASKRPRTDE
jgi:uncharacterized coiled-coil DUF342 family protein